jgi:sarcosine oxidase
VTDGELAVIGLGSAGSMALWKAAKLSAGVPGGSSREPRARSQCRRRRLPAVPYLWRELESGSGQEILTQCGGLSIGDRRGGYIDAILRNVRETGAPHTVLGIPGAGFLRTDRAVPSAVAAAESLGTQVLDR